jgi:dTDP-4-dehydrorhamnose reductase
LGVTYHVVGTGVASWFDVALAVQKELACLGAKSAAVTPIATADWPTAARRPAFSALDASSFTRDFSHPIPDWRISLGAIVARLAS